MNPKYRQFIFKDYQFDKASHALTLHYGYDEVVHFSEKFRFDFDFVDYDETVLDRACQSLFLMAGVSYYKAYLAPEIVIKKGQLDQLGADFFSQTYQRGLGEFFYQNQLDPHTPVLFPTTVTQLDSLNDNQSPIKGILVGIGGGKDSLVSVELLRNTSEDLATWSVDFRRQLTPLIERIGLPHYWVEREWDRSLLDHNSHGAFNGHIPISAILACSGVIIAILSGRRDIVVSNEQSANEPTLNYQGVAINHQYTKSSQFEQAFQAYLAHLLGDRVRYYSLLRPLSELRIAELFAKHSFDTYHDVFSSCNRAPRRNNDHLLWDGTCPKCAFVFLALTPFLPQSALEELFSGKNLLKDPELIPTYRQLLGIEGHKPLECVGEIKESRAAMRLAFKTYPELAQTYQFELPEEYNYKTLGVHDMPAEVYQQISSQLIA